MASNFMTGDQVLDEVLCSDEEDVVGDGYGHDSDFESEDSCSDSATTARITVSDSEAQDQVRPATGRGEAEDRGDMVLGAGVEGLPSLLVSRDKLRLFTF